MSFSYIPVSPILPRRTAHRQCRNSQNTYKSPSQWSYDSRAELHRIVGLAAYFKQKCSFRQTHNFDGRLLPDAKRLRLQHLLEEPLAGRMNGRTRACRARHVGCRCLPCGARSGSRRAHRAHCARIAAARAVTNHVSTGLVHEFEHAAEIIEGLDFKALDESRERRRSSAGPTAASNPTAPLKPAVPLRPSFDRALNAQLTVAGRDP